MPSDRRKKLHEELVRIFGSDRVYFQPPASFKMTYPCIRYTLDGKDLRHADDLSYSIGDRYQVMVLSTDPDNGVINRILSEIRCSSFDRRYVFDGVYHDVCEIHI